MSTALVLADAGERENGRWAYGAQAEMFHSEQSSKSTWRKLLAQAGLILDFAPEAATEVVARIERTPRAKDESARKIGTAERRGSQRMFRKFRCLSCGCCRTCLVLLT